MKVLVCGGPRYIDPIDRELVEDAIHDLSPFPTEVIGTDTGAGRLAIQWATRWNVPHRNFSGEMDGINVVLAFVSSGAIPRQAEAKGIRVVYKNP
jgi:hypothetical protein